MYGGLQRRKRNIKYKKKLNVRFRRKMNKDLDRNRKLFWKEVDKVYGGKVESCSCIKDENGTLTLGENEVRRIWKDSFENIYNIET